jgi:hypothetical protein
MSNNTIIKLTIIKIWLCTTYWGLSPLTSHSIPSLTIEGVYIIDTVLISLDFPMLSIVNGYLYV